MRKNKINIGSRYNFVVDPIRTRTPVVGKVVHTDPGKNIITMEIGQDCNGNPILVKVDRSQLVSRAGATTAR